MREAMQDGSMDVPALDTLIADYTAWVAAYGRPDGALVPTPGTAIELARVEAELGIHLPSDYTALATRYNLAAIEFNFSRFYPPVVRPMGLFEAFNALLNSDQYPFAAEYRRWSVVPVGEDAWQNQFVLVVRQPTEPHEESQPREMTHPLALTRPYGTVWGFYPDEMHPTLRYTFEFVGSSFEQVLHRCLLCWRESIRQRGDRAPVSRDELLKGLATIDAASREAPYWELWVEWAVKA